jgi:hypothetical protein
VTGACWSNPTAKSFFPKTGGSEESIRAPPASDPSPCDANMEVTKRNSHKVFECRRLDLSDVPRTSRGSDGLERLFSDAISGKRATGTPSSEGRLS